RWNRGIERAPALESGGSEGPDRTALVLREFRGAAVVCLQLQRARTAGFAVGDLRRDGGARRGGGLRLRSVQPFRPGDLDGGRAGAPDSVRRNLFRNRDGDSGFGAVAVHQGRGGPAGAAYAGAAASGVLGGDVVCVFRVVSGLADGRGDDGDGNASRH